ncbi:cell surface protein [Pseudomonas lactis]|uniref:Cell surface protein n=2 Tax=Pseudomonas lactis TaxID=1615674 RepID=A0A7Y1PY61_9PSED|nr:cell surface protein [Pseudomonas lactis]
MALGKGASATTANSVALGSDASTADAVATPSGVINGTTYNYAGATPTGVVSVGSAGNERQITNVAAGRVSGSSTDAINGSQLFATNTAVDQVGTSLDGIVNGGAGIKYLHSNSTLADGTATGTDSVVVGPVSNASATNAMALGKGASATTANSVALGSDASTADAVATPSGVINGTTYNYAGATPTGVVSVGSAGNERQITNVAAGQVSGSSTDAINGSQLFATNTAVESVSSSLSNINNGAGIKYFHSNSENPQDSQAVGQEAIAVGAATVVNGDSGIGIGNQANISQAAIGGIAIGRNTQVQQASGIAIGSEAQAQGDQSLALGAGAVASQAASIALGSNSITLNGAQNGYSAYGVASPQTSVGELGIGTSLGNRKITGVAAGSSPNDAVNVEQLTTVGDQVAKNTVDITSLGGRVSTVEGSVRDITNGGGVKYFRVNSSQADSVASGTDSVALGGNAQASGSASVASGSDAQASGAGAVAMGNGATSTADGSVALGQGASDNGRGAEVYTGKYSNLSNTSTGTVSVGSAVTGATRTISNVADGREATDAVNVRQLDGAVAESKQYTDSSLQGVNKNIDNIDSSISKVDGRVTQVESNVSKVQNGTDGMFQVNNTGSGNKPSATGANAVAGGAGSIASGNNSIAQGTNANATGENAVAVGNGARASNKNSTALGANSVADRDDSVSVGAVGSERQITNVAAATKSTDAVNFDQLNKSVSAITNNANGYTDQRYSELKRDLKQQDDTLSAGIAGAMAMASLPQSYSPGASMTSIGTATYRGQSALSLGVSTISNNGRWVGKLQATTNTQGDAGIGVGVGYQW